jgi:hypothetical protein
VAWIRNNWRPYSSNLESKANLKVNPIQVVWQTQKAAVEEELRAILGVDELDPTDPACFQQRNAAIKRVINMMNEQERAELQAKVQDIKARGNPEAVKHE